MTPMVRIHWGQEKPTLRKDLILDTMNKPLHIVHGVLSLDIGASKELSSVSFANTTAKDIGYHLWIERPGQLAAMPRPRVGHRRQLK